MNFDNITTAHRDRLGARIGFLSDDEDEAVLLAIQEAFALNFLLVMVAARRRWLGP